MARNIGADGSDVYRAVITLGDSTTPRYEGPYNSPGAARARVSFWRNHLAKSGSSATGHVERADTVWRPLDEPPQPDPPTAPQPAPAAALTADERQFLTFALNLAADHMASRGDEFTDADETALENLRRIADEAPLSPYYSHPECGFHWHGRDGMDIPTQADGQPICPRCELRRRAEEPTP